MAKAFLKMRKYVRRREVYDRLVLLGYKDVQLGSKLSVLHMHDRYYFAVILADDWQGYKANTIAISVNDTCFAVTGAFRLEFETYDMMMEFIDAVLRN